MPAYSILQTLIAVALAFWGSLGTILMPNIVTIDVPADGHTAGALWPLEDNTCTIRLRPQFYELDANMQQLAIMHEVGHCIGLDHISEPGIMNPVLTASTHESPADVAEFNRVHPAAPRPFRVLVPSLAR